MLVAITLILLIWNLQGCVTVTINIDQGKSLVTAPMEYEEDEEQTDEVYVSHKKHI
jgi:hypothetical protein